MRPPLDTNRPPRRRVLVADDNQTMAQGLKLVLELWGCEVVVAYDGRAALAAVRDPRFDAVLLDLGLPLLDGLQIARAVREQEGGARVQLVAVTGYDDETHRALSRDAGFDHYLTKPVDPKVLQALLLAPAATRIYTNSR
jgi:DNA-binding response OmpR family regulator